MYKRLISFFVGLFLILSSQSALAYCVCKDGHVSHSRGRGTCSHHGGVSYCSKTISQQTLSPVVIEPTIKPKSKK